MNNVKKIIAILTVATFAGVAACSMSTSMDATIEHDAEATTNLKEAAKISGKPIDDDVIRVKNDIWLGDKSDIEFEGEPVPAHLEGAEGITLISNRPITLYEIGDKINKITSLRVRYAPQLEPETIKNATDNVPSFDTIGADWTEPNKMLVSYRGPLSGLLDEVASRFGIWWKYEKNELYFYKYITRTFVLYSLPTKSSLTANIGGNADQAGGSSSLSLSKAAEIEMWANIEKSITSMVDKEAKLSMDSANGTISLTANPADIKKVAKYINEQNARLSRQVAISVKVLQVSLDDSDNYGLDVKAAFDDGTTKVGIASAPGLPRTDFPNNLTVGLAPANWNFDLGVQALSKQGNVSLVTSGTVTTLNNKPAPIQVVRKETYIAEITKTNSGGDGNFYDVSTETKDLETGFTLDVLPRILEHGRLLVMFNLTLSDLLEMEKIVVDASTGQYIQNPKIEARGFTQEVAMKSGETLILTGFEKVETQTNKQGIGSATHSLLGGSATAERNRVVMVIILTPIVIDSPLTPESRMKVY